MHDNISITDLITAASSRGFDLGKGQPREHLSYLGRIGLLPPAKKRKNPQGFIEGYYPLAVIERLEALTDMKKQGMTFSQMKRVLDDRKSMVESGFTNEFPVSSHDPQYQSSTPYHQPLNFTPSQPSYLAILIIGIVLGYFLAISRGSALPPTINGVNARDLISSQASVSQPAIDSNAESIYVVSVPESHFAKLDKSINIKF